MEKLNTLLHSEPFKAVDLPFSTQEFLKPTSVSINFYNKEIKLFHLLDELHSFVNFPRTLPLCSVAAVVGLWTFHFHCISTILQEGRRREIQTSHLDYLLIALTKHTLSFVFAFCD